jgi:AraC-like DNA-binding protein
MDARQPSRRRLPPRSTTCVTRGFRNVRPLELIRLGRAATLLERSNLTVTEVAVSVGFRDPLHFSRRFRRAYGVSPRAYRAGGPQGGPVRYSWAARGVEAIGGRLITERCR